MRIISGQFGGQALAAPHGHKTHPMSDKIRGALFNTLGDVSSLTFLDAFAGSGAIGLEAISRGAASVVAIDSDKNAHRCMQQNAQSLCAKNYKAIRANVNSWQANNPDDSFDIVVADPPYDKVPTATLQNLSKLISVGGLLVLSLPPKFIIDIPRLKIIDQKYYGDAELHFYRN